MARMAPKVAHEQGHKAPDAANATYNLTHIDRELAHLAHELAIWFRSWLIRLRSWSI